MTALSALLVMALAAVPQPPVAVIVVPPAGESQELVLLDGTRAIGRVERVTDDAISFRTIAGALLEVERPQVARISRVDGRVVQSEFWKADSNTTRLLFGPTGRSLKRGEAYLGIYEFLLPFVQVGVTDRLSIGGGTYPIFGAGTPHPFWFTPKLQVFASGKTEGAVGVLHLDNVGKARVGVAYGVVTRGTADTAVTAGIGYAYARGNGSGGGGPVVMIGGENRVGRRVKLVTENYVFRGGGFVSGGARLLRDRLTVDLGLMSPLGAEVFLVFPMVNFVWTFSPSARGR